jgi:hypothetical protein
VVVAPSRLEHPPGDRVKTDRRDARRLAHLLHDRVGLATEVGDWQRFTGATIGAYLGLTPTENSSGASRSQGSITKAGNTHARRLLVEAAWHHRKPMRCGPSRTTRTRRSAVAPAVRARARAADERLHRRWLQLEARKKRPTIAAVAVARELAGWCWSLAVMDDEEPDDYGRSNPCSLSYRRHTTWSAAGAVSGSA